MILLLHQIIFTFQKESFKRIQKLIKKIDDKVRDQKVPYNISRRAAKISALSSDIIDKYEFLTGEEVLPSDQKL